MANIVRITVITILLSVGGVIEHSTIKDTESTLDGKESSLINCVDSIGDIVLAPSAELSSVTALKRAF